MHEEIPGDARVLGQQGTTRFVESVLPEFDDVRIEPVSAQKSGELAVLEYRFTAIDRQRGQPLDFRGIIVFELDRGQIRRSADYYDVATILAQLGLLDLEEAGPAATPVA
jgi:hypothetical protein